MKTAFHIKQAFTLVELLVVLSISIVMISLISVGAIYLQTSSDLDNSIRTIKSQVESTQNKARNTFLGSDIGVPLDQRHVTMGWIINLINSSNNQITLTQRAIYFVPTNVTNGYNYDGLRNDISTLRTLIQKSNSFYCDSNNILKLNNNNYILFGSIAPVQCSVPADTNNFSTSSINGIQFTTLPTSPNLNIPNCSYISSYGVTIFYTSGYGEPSTSNIAALPSCAIQIYNINYVHNYREVKVDLNILSGGIETCGATC